MPASAPEVLSATDVAAPPETVLIVDDEDSFRSVVARQLRNAGYGTLEARDGSEAVKLYGEHRAAIVAVLLDLVMPNTSGGETLAILRYYDPALPVVVTSGYSEHEARSLGQAERGVGFLKKPFSAVELTTELRRVMNERLPTHRHSTPPRPSA